MAIPGACYNHGWLGRSDHNQPSSSLTPVSAAAALQASAPAAARTGPCRAAALHAQCLNTCPYSGLKPRPATQVLEILLAASSCIPVQHRAFSSGSLHSTSGGGPAEQSPAVPPLHTYCTHTVPLCPHMLQAHKRSTVMSLTKDMFKQRIYSNKHQQVYGCKATCASQVHVQQTVRKPKREHQAEYIQHSRPTRASGGTTRHPLTTSPNSKHSTASLHRPCCCFSRCSITQHLLIHSHQRTSTMLWTCTRQGALSAAPWLQCSHHTPLHTLLLEITGILSTALAATTAAAERTTTHTMTHTLQIQLQWWLINVKRAY